jgi:Photosynthesis system II assembly factor YCF48
VLLLTLLLSSSWHIHAAERWKMQFYYNKDESNFDIRDLKCPSPQRCIAAGVLVEKSEKEKGAVLITSDGGKQWSFVDFKDRPLSTFFVNESVGWIAAEHGVWQTDESGRGWKKVDGLKKGIQRIFFVSPSHGYAIGYPNALYETTDGGKTWPKLPAASDVVLAKYEAVSYECIDFRGDHGLILGRVIGRDTERPPAWMDPEQSARTHRKSIIVGLETFDAGKTWKPTTHTAAGTPAQLKLADDGVALVLLEYKDAYSVPSSLVTVKFAVKAAASVFTEPDRAVTDFLTLPNGEAFLAAVATPGNSNQVPIPGKLKILRSKNLKVWIEMDADYRAVAQRAVIAAADARHIWVATDTGMILNLVETQN